VRVNELSLGRGMRMRRFISGLESVKNMSLSLAAWRQGLVFLSLKNEGELRAWASHVGGLLNCIVQRGCTSLTITDGSSIEPDRPSVLNWMVRWLIPKGSNDMPTPPPPFPAGPLHLTTLITNRHSYGGPWNLVGFSRIAPGADNHPVSQSGPVRRIHLGRRPPAHRRRRT
jgi:hypothetical protein